MASLRASLLAKIGRSVHIVTDRDMLMFGLFSRFDYKTSLLRNNDQMIVLNRPQKVNFSKTQLFGATCIGRGKTV